MWLKKNDALLHLALFSLFSWQKCRPIWMHIYSIWILLFPRGRLHSSLDCAHVFFRATGKLLKTPPLRIGLADDNSIKYSSQKDHAFCSFPLAKPRHRLKSTATKQTAVNWESGIEENRVPAHAPVPVLPHHHNDSASKSETVAGRGGPRTLMFHSSDLRTLPLLHYENITVMKILLIGVASF